MKIVNMLVGEGITLKVIDLGLCSAAIHYSAVTKTVSPSQKEPLLYMTSTIYLITHVSVQYSVLQGNKCSKRFILYSQLQQCLSLSEFATAQHFPHF